MGNLGNLKKNCLHSDWRKKFASAQSMVEKIPAILKSQYPPPPPRGNNGPPQHTLQHTFPEEEQFTLSKYWIYLVLFDKYLLCCEIYLQFSYFINGLHRISMRSSTFLW